MCFFKTQNIVPSPKGIIPADEIVNDGRSVTINRRLITVTVADTNSMLPLIDNGDIAGLTDEFDKSELAKGDVVVYQVDPYRTIIHRIIRIDESDIGRVYTCKGDSNMGKDPYQLLDEHILYLMVGVIYCKK